MTDNVVFVDCETTGLDPERHEVYEIALIDAEGEHVYWPMLEHLESADATALRLTHYYERKPTRSHGRAGIAGHVARRTAGKHLVGAVPSFDAAFLTAFLRHQGYAPAWHHHLVDVEALAAGRLGLKPPWDSEHLSRQLLVEPPQNEGRHTALADARWAKAIYEAVMA